MNSQNRYRSILLLVSICLPRRRDINESEKSFFFRLVVCVCSKSTDNMIYCSRRAGRRTCDRTTHATYLTGLVAFYPSRHRNACNRTNSCMTFDRNGAVVSSSVVYSFCCHALLQRWKIRSDFSKSSNTQLLISPKQTHHTLE